MLEERELSARIAADMIGIEFEVMVQHPELLGLFVLLHELGHAKYYLSEFENKAPGKSRLVAFEEYERASNLAKCALTFVLPIDDNEPRGITPFDLDKLEDEGNLDAFFQRNRKYFRDYGVNNKRELVRRVVEDYYKLPQEKAANEYSANFIRLHWKELEFDRKTGIESPSDVQFLI